jgi:hypothetical protein
MIRILFVDDEAAVLEAMLRGMHCMRNEWSMDFVSSGPAALEGLGLLDHLPEWSSAIDAASARPPA